MDEFGDEQDVDADLNAEDAEVETAEEYAYVEPSTDVPAPGDDVPDQNPGFIEGAHS
jgi:hypothetical protein